MNMTKIIIATQILLCCYVCSYAQIINDENRRTSNSEEDILYRQAILQYERGNFTDATEIYKKIIAIQPTEFDINYELAMLYFYELNEKKESIPYFLSAIKNMKDTVPDIFNYTGQAYQFINEYDKAIEMYRIYSNIPPRPGLIKISMRRYINRCMAEKEMIAEIKLKKEEIDSSGIRVVNAGHKVNCEYADFAPRLLSEAGLIYTSTRDFDYQFERWIDKPYFAKLENKEFVENDKLSNTIYADVVLDPEWNIIITDFLEDMSKVVSIYENFAFYREGGLDKHIETVKLPKAINFSRISSAAISTDGIRMMFSAFDNKSNNWDLYITTRQLNGVWRTPEKLTALSSDKDEQYPFFSADGLTVYFSSTGFNSMGGHDIFKSTLQINNEWSAPERLPEPINSVANDTWFSITKDGEKAYFSSDREGGFGSLDIYEVLF